MRYEKRSIIGEADLERLERVDDELLIVRVENSSESSEQSAPIGIRRIRRQSKRVLEAAQQWDDV